MQLFFDKIMNTRLKKQRARNSLTATGSLLPLFWRDFIK